MEIKIIQLHKKAAGTFDNIEDKVGFNPDNRSFAIADGATQSFQSGFWADLLVSEFIANPVFNKESFCTGILQKCLPEFEAWSSSVPAPTNKSIAMLDKEQRKEGASATFLGVRISENGACKILSCGDCVLIRSTPGIKPDYFFPFTDLDALNANTAFLSSRRVAEHKFETSLLSTEELYVDDQDELYLLTDALARFAFKNETALRQLGSMDSFRQLLTFAEHHWANGVLDNDDLTYVRISRVRERGAHVQKISPYNGFSFNSIEPPLPPPVPPLVPPVSVPPVSVPPPHRQVTPDQLQLLKTETRQRFLFLAAIVSLLIIIQAFTLLSAGRTHSRLNTLEDWKHSATDDISRLNDTVVNLRHRHTQPSVSAPPVSVSPITAPAGTAPAIHLDKPKTGDSKQHLRLKSQQTLPAADPDSKKKPDSTGVEEISLLN
jgi:hypothetical protein